MYQCIRYCDFLSYLHTVHKSKCIHIVTFCPTYIHVKQKYKLWLLVLWLFVRQGKKYRLWLFVLRVLWLFVLFDNLVKFVYKLGKNWQTRAWDPVFKTAGSAPDAAMILGLFSEKNLKINIDRKLHWIVHFYLDLFCASSERYSNNQNYEVKQGEQGRVENSSCKPQKAK